MLCARIAHSARASVTGKLRGHPLRRSPGWVTLRFIWFDWLTHLFWLIGPTTLMGHGKPCVMKRFGFPLSC